MSKGVLKLAGKPPGPFGAAHAAAADDGLVVVVPERNTNVPPLPLHDETLML